MANNRSCQHQTIRDFFSLFFFYDIHSKLTNASATYAASDSEELIPLFKEISNTTIILERSVCVRMCVCVKKRIISGLVVKITFKYIEVELRNPFLILWNENSNALILYFWKSDQCSATVCTGLFTRICLSSFTFVQHCTLWQLVRLYLKLKLKKSPQTKEAQAAIKYLNY